MKIFFIILLFVIFSCGVFYKFVFLRDNRNRIPEGENIVSPASGKIISIQEVDQNMSLEIRKGFLGKIQTRIDAGEPYYLINIFMSVLNVHINKMPIDGKIIETSHADGKFKPVMTLEAGLENEKQEFLIQSRIGLVKVIQIAGFLARRTKSFVEEGQLLQKGKAFGMITLGSQVALLVPKKSCDLQVKVGAKVSSGETIGLASVEIKPSGSDVQE